MKFLNACLYTGKLCYFILLISCILALYACPYSSPYKLNKDSPIAVDEALLGKWATMRLNKEADELPIKMILSRKNDTEYNIDLTGGLEELERYGVVRDDSIKGSAYMSMVADHPFLNIEIKGQTYIAALLYKNNKLSLLPLTDGFTAKYVRSDAELKKAVEVHLRTRVFPLFDNQFCLKDMVRVN